MAGLYLEMDYWEKGDSRGREDRDVLEVTVLWSETRLPANARVVARFGFSSNWDPHAFSVTSGIRGWDAALDYTVGDESHSILFDFKVEDELRRTVRAFLHKQCSFAELRAAVA